MTDTTLDWIDQLFADDLGGWRIYLWTQMEYLTAEPQYMAELWTRIDEGDKDELRKVSQEIADLLPPIDPARQFNERMKNQ